jgi:antibiotic biosynthesis monooxygenase (ABM) superfamily enzyme
VVDSRSMNITTRPTPPRTPAAQNPGSRPSAQQTPGQQVPRPLGPPRRWKLWLAMICGIYPVILAVETAGEPLLRHMVPAAQFAIVVPIMVAVMVWVVLPQIHRRFAGWPAR